MGTDNDHSKKVFDAADTDTLPGHSLPLLRFEVEYHREGLMKALGIKHSQGLHLHDVLDWYQALNFRDWYDSFLKSFDRPGPQSNLTEIESILSTMPKPQIYRDFVREIIDFGLDWVQANTNRRVYYYRLAQLRKFGIEPAHLQSHWARATAYQLPTVRKLAELPIDAGYSGEEPRDDFSVLVSALSTQSVIALKKMKKIVTEVVQNAI